MIYFIPLLERFYTTFGTSNARILSGNIHGNMSASKNSDDSGAPVTRSRSYRGQSQSQNAKGEEAYHQRTEAMEKATIDGDNSLDLAIESKIKTALCSPEVLNALVAAVKEAIIGKVTQQVYAALKMDMESKEEETKLEKRKIDKLEGKINRLQEKLDEHEQYSRRNCLRFFGIKETQGENTDELVCDLARDRLNIELSPGDIDRSHRITPRNRNFNGITKDKSVIVKFSTYNMRQKVYEARSKLKGTSIFINEDLTGERQQLLYAARKSRAIAWTWTQDGKIFAITATERKRVIIQNLRDIDRLG